MNIKTEVLMPFQRQDFGLLIDYEPLIRHVYSLVQKDVRFPDKIRYICGNAIPLGRVEPQNMITPK